MIQPHSLLTVVGEKRLDLRSKQHPHRGPLLIHALKTWSKEQSTWLLDDPVWKILSRYLKFKDFSGLFAERLEPIDERESLHFGAIIGQVDLLNCVHIDQLTKPKFGQAPFDWAMAGIDPAKEKLLNHEFDGRYPWCLVFGNPVWFSQPIPCRGMPGVFTVPDAVALQAEKELKQNEQRVQRGS